MAGLVFFAASLAASLGASEHVREVVHESCRTQLCKARAVMEGRTKSTAPACACLSALPRRLSYGIFYGWMHLLFAAISPPSHCFYCLPRGQVLARQAVLFVKHSYLLVALLLFVGLFVALLVSLSLSMFS